MKKSLGALLLLALAAPAWAQEAPPEPEEGSGYANDPATMDDWLNDGASAADGVFLGTVVRIEYRESDRGPRGTTIPHTFVTWRVDDAYKGVERGTEVTARFIGGVTDDGRRAVRISGQAEFDLGDQDVLFVAENGDAACPLVGCTAGRLRVIDGVVYTDDGRALGLDRERGLYLGPVVELEAIRSTTIGGVTFRTRGDASPEPDPDEEAPRFEAPAASDVLRFVADTVSQYPAERRFESVGPRTPFVVEIEL